MAKATPKAKIVNVPVTPEPAPEEAVLRARYFRTHANVTEEIDRWAAEQGVRVRAVLPVHWEGIQHD